MSENPSVENDAQEVGFVPVYPGIFRHPLLDGGEPALIGNYCRRCDKSFFPKKTACPLCLENGLEELVLARKGVIYASTVVHIDSPSGIKVPYAFGYVDIPENRLRLFALFTGGDPSSFLPGAEVELVFEPLGTNGSGQTIIAHKFRRVA
jgi:uncharacterized OB-fold protein